MNVYQLFPDREEDTEMTAADLQASIEAMEQALRVLESLHEFRERYLKAENNA